MKKCCICKKDPEDCFRRHDMYTGELFDNLYVFQGNYFCSPYCSLIFFQQNYYNKIDNE